MIELQLRELSTLSSQEIKELQAKLFAVHVTDFKPVNFKQIAGSGYSVVQKRFEEKKLPTANIPNTRPKLHWCLGRSVPAVYSGEDNTPIQTSQRKYAIITNLHNLYPQLINVYIKDTIILGDYQLTDKDYVLIPEGEDPSAWNAAGATVNFYSSNHTTLEVAVRDFIKSKDGIIITRNKDLNKDKDTETAEVLNIEDANIVFNEKDPSILSGMLESLKGVSFGRDEKSFNDGWITPYIGGTQEPLFIEILALFLLEEGEPFYVKNREIYLETTQGLLLCIRESLRKAICESELYNHEIKEYFMQQQKQMYHWVKFLEIENYLYVNHKKTLTGAKDVDCIAYLITHIDLPIEELLNYTKKHLENFQFINDITAKYKTLEEKEGFTSYFRGNIMSNILLEDFEKEPSLANNPGNILLFIISKYKYDNIKDMPELPAELNILINLLNKSLLLNNANTSKHNYIKSVLDDCYTKEMLTLLVTRSSIFNECYDKINNIGNNNSNLRLYSVAFSSSNSEGTEADNQSVCLTEPVEKPKKKTPKL